MAHKMVSHSILNEAKENISLSIPLIASWLIYALSGFIGTMMVARLGEDALAASVLIATIWMVLSAFFFGLLNSVSVLVAHQYGARNYDAISWIMGQSFLLALVICAPVMLIMAFIPMLLRSLIQNQHVLALSIDYAHALLWSTPGLEILVILEQFFNGIGRTKLSLGVSLIEVPFEILLIYIFVFGKLGLPAFGIAGVGYGFTASYTITVILLGLYLHYARFAQPFHIFKKIGRVSKQYCKELITVGFPIGLMYLIEITAFTAATLMMAKFNTVALAAHQITMQYLGFTINMAFAMSQTVAIRIGHNIGRGDLTGVEYSSYVGLGLGCIFMFFIFLIYIFFPEWLLRIDIDIYKPENAALVKQTISFLMILGVFQLFDNIRIIEAGALRGLKDTRFPMYLSFICFWLVGLVSAYIFAFLMRWEGIGIWAGLTLGIAVGAVLFFLRLKKILSKTELSKLIHA